MPSLDELRDAIDTAVLAHRAESNVATYEAVMEAMRTYHDAALWAEINEFKENN